MSKKKITGNDGKTYVMKEKKPFYKKIWFWIVVVLFVAIIGGALGGGSDEPSTKKVSEADSTSSNEDNALDQTYSVGDVVSYKGYEIKVNKVDYSQGSEYIKPDDGKQFVVVNITITNNTDNKQSYNPFDYSLNADGNSTSLTSYMEGVDTLNSGELDPGASVSGNLVGSAPTEATSLKLQYKSNFWNDETVDINLK
ncbi:DUF4352 domain-containing protein [Candidatus Enterococcus ferrettii]|uniref:DUF4352 domain-containing protein n=1 Tax=Candidatus Enterococcus ferrettii TaxID=2815324 RepID=A0ABV0EV13_9ENTE|nr:DUF4352 domain-containing protein [Enterococcus sp. 665A]MBO1340353.1 DUF4352 domain-containing protein [Enterococcus sp. 665A]